MQLKHVPTIDAKYWSALVLASIFGANTGDFFANVLKLGHISGLPALAGLFALAVLVEKFDKRSHYFYFWFVIVVIRTSATNLGDIAHDLRLYAPAVIAVLSVLLLAIVVAWRQVYLARKKSGTESSQSILVTNPAYWLSMLTAGTLGTVVGDYFSFGLRLFPLKAAIFLGGVLAIAFVIFRKNLKGDHINIFCYWLTVVLIRSAGTSAGDFLAAQLHLPLSTLLTGLVFVGVLLLARSRAAA